MIYAVRHITRLAYLGSVRLARFNVRLKPADWPGQTLQNFSLRIDPLPWTVQEEIGPFVVNRSRLNIRDPLSRLTIESRFQVEVAATSFVRDMLAGPTVEQVRRHALTHSDLSALGPASYLYASSVAARSVEIGEWSRPFFGSGEPVMSAAQRLMEAIHREFRYDPKATGAETPPLVAFNQRSGVCQDFAHIMIAGLRGLGLPAAYVSGYIRTIPPPGEKRLEGSDASHAWVMLWCGPDIGWVGLDPTNDLIVANDHIVTGFGRDYADVSPLDGVLVGPGSQKIGIAVDVIPVG